MTITDGDGDTLRFDETTLTNGQSILGVTCNMQSASPPRTAAMYLTIEDARKVIERLQKFCAGIRD